MEYSHQKIKYKCEEIEVNILQNTANSIDIYVKDIPVSYVAYSRYTGPCNKDEFYLRFTKLTNIVEMNDLQMTGTMMAIYYDDIENLIIQKQI